MSESETAAAAAEEEEGEEGWQSGEDLEDYPEQDTRWSTWSDPPTWEAPYNWWKANSCDEGMSCKRCHAVAQAEDARARARAHAHAHAQATAKAEKGIAEGTAIEAGAGAGTMGTTDAGAGEKDSDTEPYVHPAREWYTRRELDESDAYDVYDAKWGPPIPVPPQVLDDARALAAFLYSRHAGEAREAEEASEPGGTGGTTETTETAAKTGETTADCGGGGPPPGAPPARLVLYNCADSFAGGFKRLLREREGMMRVSGTCYTRRDQLQRSDPRLIAALREYGVARAAGSAARVAYVPPWFTYEIEGTEEGCERIHVDFPWRRLTELLLAGADDDPLVRAVRSGALELPSPPWDRGV